MSNSQFITVDSDRAELIAKDYAINGWRIFRLSRHVSTAEEFVADVRNVIPLDPPLRGNRNWDAFADSIWGGLDSLEDQNILIVWPSSSVLRDAGYREHEIIESTLKDLPVSLGDPGQTGGAPKNLVVLCVI